MDNIRIIGKKGSKACKAIVNESGIRRYFGRKTQADVLVNYGLAGKKLDQFYRKFPSARKIPTINSAIGHSKLRVVNMAKQKDILVPDSKLSLSKSDNIKEWIEKRFSSEGGKGICFARGKSSLLGKYYQKFIGNRVYELRVHAFKWIDTEAYQVQKRVGDKDEVAWNFKNGGRFITVNNPNSYRVFKEAKETSNTILDMLNMSFGAVDFLVDTDYKLYFIEVNSAPGFSGLSDVIYIDAFKALKALPKKEMMKHV